MRTVHFRALQPQTKAQFGAPKNGAWPTLWTSNDSEVKLSLNYGSAVAASVTVSPEGESATFDAQFDFSESGSGPYTFYSISPASAAQALSPSRQAWRVSIPCDQTPTAASVDEAGIILVASSQAYTEQTELEVVDLHFNHLTAYGLLTLSNLALADGETVLAVELTATTPLVGDWYWSCTDGLQPLDGGASSTLTLHTSGTSDIWFACAPVDMSGQIVTVLVYTDQGCFEQLVEFSDNRQFEPGRAAVFTIDMTGADYTAGSSGGVVSWDFTLVKDASTLAVGDKIIITNLDASKALGAAASSSTSDYRRAVDITKIGNCLSEFDSATILTLLAGKVDGTWAFDTGSGYLAATDKKNSITTTETIGDDNLSSWTISITNGEATIMAQAGTYNFLRYNYNQGSGSRFSAYMSTATLPGPAIYRRSASGNGSAPADPLLALTEYGCYLGTGLDWVFAAGVDQVTRAYSADEVLTYTLIKISTVEELEISGYTRGLVKGDPVSVTVNWRQGSTSVLSQTYVMRVVKEAGPKVWLSDGAGLGVIIKK